MQIILMENVENVGLPGELANVKPGYFRNFLGPRGLAVKATPGNLKSLEEKRAKLDKAAEEIRGAAKELGVRLQAVPLKFVEKNSETGRLFGSVSTGDIARKLGEQGFEIDRRQIAMRQAIKDIGTYSAVVKLHAGHSVTIEIEVDPETPLPERKPAPEPSEEEAEEGGVDAAAEGEAAEAGESSEGGADAEEAKAGDAKAEEAKDEDSAEKAEGDS